MGSPYVGPLWVCAKRTHMRGVQGADYVRNHNLTTVLSERCLSALRTVSSLRLWVSAPYCALGSSGHDHGEGGMILMDPKGPKYPNVEYIWFLREESE